MGGAQTFNALRTKNNGRIFAGDTTAFKIREIIEDVSKRSTEHVSPTHRERLSVTCLRSSEPPVDARFLPSSARDVGEEVPARVVTQVLSDALPKSRWWRFQCALAEAGYRNAPSDIPTQVWDDRSRLKAVLEQRSLCDLRVRMDRVPDSLIELLQLDPDGDPPDAPKDLLIVHRLRRLQGPSSVGKLLKTLDGAVQFTESNSRLWVLEKPPLEYAERYATSVGDAPYAALGTIINLVGTYGSGDPDSLGQQIHVIRNPYRIRRRSPHIGESYDTELDSLYRKAVELRAAITQLDLCWRKHTEEPLKQMQISRVDQLMKDTVAWLEHAKNPEKCTVKSAVCGASISLNGNGTGQRRNPSAAGAKLVRAERTTTRRADDVQSIDRTVDDDARLAARTISEAEQCFEVLGKALIVRSTYRDKEDLAIAHFIRALKPAERRGASPLLHSLKIPENSALQLRPWRVFADGARSLWKELESSSFLGSKRAATSAAQGLFTTVRLCRAVTAAERLRELVSKNAPLGMLLAQTLLIEDRLSRVPYLGKLFDPRFQDSYDAALKFCDAMYTYFHSTWPAEPIDKKSPEFTALKRSFKDVADAPELDVEAIYARQITTLYPELLEQCRPPLRTPLYTR